MLATHPIKPLKPLTDEQRRLLEFYATQAQREDSMVVRWRGAQMRVELVRNVEARSA